MPKEEEKDRSFVSFYRKGATIHMSLKISKDGDSRKEDTEVLKGMYDEQRGMFGGLPLVADAITEIGEEQETGRRRRLKGV